MITRNPNGFVRVASLCVGALLIINGTGCALHRSTPTVEIVSATAPMAAPMAVPMAAPMPESDTLPGPIRQGAGAPVPPMGESTSTPPSASPVQSSGDSTPSDPATNTQSSQALNSAQVLATHSPVSALPSPKIDHRKHAGNYRCDHGRTIRITDVPNQTDVILLTWQGTQHRLVRVHSNSGAERFEELSTGLVWILIPDKAILLSTNQGRALANECRL